MFFQHWTSHELHVKWIRRIMKVNPPNLISDRSLMFGHLEKFLTMNWPLILLKTIRPGFNHPYIQMIDNPGKSNYQNNKDTFQAICTHYPSWMICAFGWKEWGGIRRQVLQLFNPRTEDKLHYIYSSIYIEILSQSKDIKPPCCGQNIGWTDKLAVEVSEAGWSSSGRSHFLHSFICDTLLWRGGSHRRWL